MVGGFQKMVKVLVVIASISLAFLSHAEDESVLLWMVTDPLDESSGLMISELKYIRDMADEDKYAVARVAVFDDSGNRVTEADGAYTYLSVWGENGERADGIVLPSAEGTWTSERPTYADVSGYSASYSFMIEIGIFDEATDAWVILAHSESATYQELYTAGDIVDGSLVAPEHAPWSGGNYSVPEPSSGLLILMGAGLLALRRRRRAA